MKADLLSANLGSIITIQPLTPRGRKWLRAHVEDRQLDDSVIAEHRCGIDILYGALGNGLTLADKTTERLVSTRGKIGGSDV